jgi:hypothetical protein
LERHSYSLNVELDSALAALGDGLCAAVPAGVDGGWEGVAHVWCVGQRGGYVVVCLGCEESLLTSRVWGFI